MNIVIPENAVEDKHVVLEDMPWEMYEAFLRISDEDQQTRITYDRGTMEIRMTLSMGHEVYKSTIGLMIDLVASEFDVPMVAAGSTTLKVQSKGRGLEADECYWIAHERLVRGLERLDLTVHPAPDLVVEVDVTNAVVDRESIYASFGVPEMWHYAAKTGLTAWRNEGEAWTRIERSLSLPMIRVDDLNPFLARVATEGRTKVIRDFRAWLTTLPR